MTTVLEEQPDLVRGLLSPSAYPAACACTEVELVETHISWVFLTGRFAYKVKKPLNLGFLDFTSLDRRHHFCQEEMRLNSRLPGDLYMEVVAISGSRENPVMEGSGEALEYAVKMHQFDQAQMLSRQLEEGRLDELHIDRVAELAGELHASVARSQATDPHGTPTLAHAPCMQNFEQLRELLRDPARLQRLTVLHKWTEKEFVALEPLLADRKRGGFVRECHGDLHLGNITEREGEIVFFDGIEFNENFRWIDVMSELAFLFTDLEHRSRRDLAWRALNSYLQVTGDFEGLPLLRYYRLHRIMVRTKIDAFRLGQPGLDEAEHEQLEADLDHYLDQADRTVHRARPHLVLTRGLSGSGKTFLSQGLLQVMGALRLRSDVERKRLFGLPPTAPSGSPLGAGIYTEQATEQTFARLRELAAIILEAGYPVIVDATFLQPERIEPFRQLAGDQGVPFVVLDLRASEAELRARIARRKHDSREASEAGQEVLTSQLTRYQPLEGPDCVAIDAERGWDAIEIWERIQGASKGVG